jgi:hypothetical protein
VGALGLNTHVYKSLALLSRLNFAGPTTRLAASITFSGSFCAISCSNLMFSSVADSFERCDFSSLTSPACWLIKRSISVLDFLCSDLRRYIIPVSTNVAKPSWYVSPLISFLFWVISFSFTEMNVLFRWIAVVTLSKL